MLQFGSGPFRTEPSTDITDITETIVLKQLVVSETESRRR